MKYYSEITKKFYEFESACLDAEAEAMKAREAAEAEKRQKTEERKRRADEVEAARQDYLEARKIYNELLTKFCRDYGAYHCSIKDGQTESLGDYLDTFFGLF